MLAGRRLDKMASRCKKMNRRTTTHITMFIILFFITLSKISSKHLSEKYQQKKCNEFEVSPYTKLVCQQLETLQVAVKLLRSKHLMNKPTKVQNTVILLLIILSNDVQLNPGPKETTPPDSVQCSTCKQWYTISLKQDINSSFQWVCPSPNCSPNLKQENLQTSNLSSPNKYTNLISAEEHNTQTSEVKKSKKKSSTASKPKQNKNPKPQRKSSNHNNLMNELPKISSDDYIGKDLCRSCSKEVKGHQQAIHCDRCERWIHRACSDMKVYFYNQCKKKKRFRWTCDKCRKDDDLIDDKADVTELEEKYRPYSWEKIVKMGKEMLIIHMNCRSIHNKEEELNKIVEDLDPDIITLSETWLGDDAPTQTCVPEGYKIIRKDRSDSFKQKYGRNRGGGVAIIYKENIKIEKIKYATEEVEEILWCHVKTRESFMLGVVYRAEYTDVIDDQEKECKLEENIRKVRELSSKVLLMGDFNIDLLDSNSRNTELLKGIYETYGLKQHISKPTRINKSTSKPTLIDHIWETEESNLIKTTGTFVALSDHFGQFAKLNLHKPVEQKEKIRFRDFKKYDVNAFNTELQRNIEASPIEEYLEASDINSATETLIKIIQETVESHAPYVEKTINPSKKSIPWFTQELKDMIKSKNEYIQDLYSHGIQSYKQRIKNISNKINQLKRNLKEKFITEKLDEAKYDSRKCWKILNKVTNRTTRKEATEPEMMTQEKANSHNRFFATIGIEIQRKLGLNVEPTPTDEADDHKEDFNFAPETEDNIGKLIDNIKIDIATGEDGISSRIIKDIKNTITPILTKIINTGYNCRKFPDCMKNAVIKVIHKKESTEEISNYRPISILPTLSKVFERAAVNQIVHYLESNHLLSHCQHAYRKSHSTVTCLYESVNYLYEMIDNKRWTAVASLDLSKAFDSISHTLLLNKLLNLGLSRSSTEWISSYLNSRTQVTKFKNFTSEKETILSGVPQGSILGPLLFLCFTNDLFQEFEDCKIISYADDTQIIVEAKKMEQLKQKIEKVITTAQKWYKNNSMKNNIGKTEVIVFSSNQKQNIKLSINVVDEGEQVIIKSKSSIKILGIILDSNLNWEKQVNAIKKAFNVTRNIHRINHLLPEKQRIKLYHALISPQFSYADIIWGGCRQKDSRRLQSVQNFAAKSITGHRKYDSATNSLKQLNFLNLHQRRQVHENVFSHRGLLQQSSANINSQYMEYTSKANTRHAEKKKLRLPKHKTAKFERSPLYRTISSWNAHPTFSFGNIEQQKTELQKHLITINAAKK